MAENILSDDFDNADSSNSLSDSEWFDDDDDTDADPDFICNSTENSEDEDLCWSDEDINLQDSMDVVINDVPTMTTEVCFQALRFDPIMNRALQYFYQIM